MTIKFIFAGDILIKDSFCPLLSSNLKSFFKEHDFVSCNLEGPFLSVDAEKSSKSGPSVFQDDGAYEMLVESGFNVFCLANNHMMDFGCESLKGTIDKLSGYTLLGAGLSFEEAYSFKTFKKGKLTVGMFAFSEWGFGALDETNKCGFAWMFHSSVERLISEAKMKCDFLIVQVHAGLELINFPLPEFREKYYTFIDAGVDVIVGHHPHVVQDFEIYKNKLICYSLGNFRFDIFSSFPKWNKGVILSLNIFDNANFEYSFIPVISTSKGVNVDSRSQPKNIKKLDADYGLKTDSMVLKIWSSRYRKTYFLGLIGGYFLLLSQYFYFLKRISLIKKFIQFHIHNNSIETHRFVISRFKKFKEK